MDFVSLCNLFVEVEENKVSFFNVKTWDVLTFSRDEIDEFEQNKNSDNPRIKLLNQVAEDHDYILFPTIGINELVMAKRVFMLKYFSKTNNPLAEFVDDSKGYNEFISKVKELDLFDEWDQILEYECKCAVYRYLLNNTENVFDYVPKYTYSLMGLKNIYLLKMWNYFTSPKLILIKS